MQDIQQTIDSAQEILVASPALSGQSNPVFNQLHPHWEVTF